MSSLTSPTPPPPAPPAGRPRFRLALGIVLTLVIAWFAAAEWATHAWYASHEARLTRNALPDDPAHVLDKLKAFVGRDGAPYRQQNVGAAAMEMLKCRFGESIYWLNETGPAAVTILKWDDNSIVGGVEGMHNPGVCLSSAGWTIKGERSLGLLDFSGATAEVKEWNVSRGTLDMRAFSAVFRRFATTGVEKTDRIHSERLDAVLAGRRDAPVYVVLAYLPASVSDAQVNKLFRELMDSIFAGSPAPANPPTAS